MAKSLNALTGGRRFGRSGSQQTLTRSSTGLNALTGGRRFGPRIGSDIMDFGTMS